MIVSPSQGTRQPRGSPILASLGGNSRRGKDQDPDDRGFDTTPSPKFSKGKNFEKADRRKGRPAHLRSPDDSALRDANRDIMLGVLTARASRTLIVYLQETNLNLAHWLASFMRANPISLSSGSWEDISGDTFLKTLLKMPVEQASYDVGRDELYDNSSSIAVDPRNIAQRILEIRLQLSKEFIEDLTLVNEDNTELLRQSLRSSLESCFELSGSSSDSDTPCEWDDDAPQGK